MTRGVTLLLIDCRQHLVVVHQFAFRGSPEQGGRFPACLLACLLACMLCYAHPCLSEVGSSHPSVCTCADDLVHILLLSALSCFHLHTLAGRGPKQGL